LNRALNYIGIARKANLLETGEDSCVAAARGGRAKLILLASDASDNAVRRAESAVWGRNIPVVRAPFTKSEIAACTGKPGCSMVVFTDIGLASSAVSALAQEDEEAYGAWAAQLGEKNERARQRAGEARAHLRNKKTGRRSKK